jgi:hypothetical protein
MTIFLQFAGEGKPFHLSIVNITFTQHANYQLIVNLLHNNLTLFRSQDISSRGIRTITAYLAHLWKPSGRPGSSSPNPKGGREREKKRKKNRKHPKPETEIKEGRANSRLRCRFSPSPPPFAFVSASRLPPQFDSLRPQDPHHDELLLSLPKGTAPIRPIRPHADRCVYLLDWFARSVTRSIPFRVCRRWARSLAIGCRRSSRSGSSAPRPGSSTRSPIISKGRCRLSLSPPRAPPCNSSPIKKSPLSFLFVLMRFSFGPCLKPPDG